MVSKYLGQTMAIEYKTSRITMLRADCDAGIASHSSRNGDFYWLVRLSDLSVIREIKKSDDFDQAILEQKR